MIGRTRQGVLNAIRVGCHTTTEIAALVHIAPNSVGYHLRALEAAGTITRTIQGVRTYWALAERNEAAA